VHVHSLFGKNVYFSLNVRPLCYVSNLL